MAKSRRWSKWSLYVTIAIFGAFVVFAIIGPAIAPHAPNAGSADALAAPSASHLMGTDSAGRDVLSRMLIGARVSLIVGVVSVVIGGVVGSTLGMVAGMSRGVIDGLVMRVMDGILAFPVIVLAAVVSGISIGHSSLSLGPVHLSQVFVLALVLALVLTPIFARIARGSVLSEMQADYVTAARACGVRRSVLLWKFLLPNIATPLLVQASFSVGLAIVAEAGISFLGLGIQPPQASWGNIIGDGQNSILLGAWWLVVFPGAAIAVVTVSCAILGEWCRELLDPRRVRPARAGMGVAAAVAAEAPGVDMEVSTR